MLLSTSVGRNGIPSNRKRNAWTGCQSVLLALSILALLGTTAFAQFGPAKVVVNKVIERPVAPVQTFVASVTPLRKSVVGTAVNGRVEEFLPYTARGWGKETVDAEGKPQYSIRLANFPHISVTAGTDLEAVAQITKLLQDEVDKAAQSGDRIAWTASAAQAEEGEELHWIVYQPDEGKLIQVVKGQPLAMLREGTIRIKVDAARAQRDLRQAEYDEAVETHDGLVAEAAARVDAATKRHGFAASNYARNQELYNRNRSVSLQELEASGTAAAEAYQEYVQARIAAEFIKRRDRIIQSRARLDEAEALYRELVDRLEKYTIRAPFNGFVVVEHTEVGAWVREGEPIAEVVQLDPVEVRAYVSEKYVTQIQIGGRAIVRPNVPLAKDQPVPIGRITGVIAEAATRSRTFPVKIQVDNPDHFLKAGMLAEVELDVGPKELATMVPKDALYIDQRYAHPQVFLAVPDEKDPQKRVPLQLSVETGASIGNWIAVKAINGAIEKGDLVVEKGNERITPATKELLPDEKGATPPPE